MNNETNPFPNDIGHGVTNENFPISEENQMLNTLLEDKNIPLDKRKKFFWIFNKDNVLTFLDEKRKKSKMLSFDIIKLDSIMNEGFYEYDFETEKEFNEMRLIFETRLDRSLGTNSSAQLNERIVQKSQFAENRNFMSDTSNSVKGKFLNRIIGGR